MSEQRRTVIRSLAPALALVVIVVLTQTPTAVALFDDGADVAANAVTTAGLDPPGSLAATATSCTTGGPPSYVDAASAVALGTAVTVATPADAQPGDLLLAQIAADDTNSVTAPGWTLIRQDKDTTDGFWQALLYRFVGPSEPGGHTFTPTQTSPSEVVAGISAYRGVDPTDPIDADGGQVTVAWLDTITAPSITTTTADTRLVGFYGRDIPDPITAPPGTVTRWTEVYDVVEDAFVLSSDEVRATAGPTGSRVATSTGSSNAIGQLVALTPAGSPTASISWTPTPSDFATGYTIERWNGGTLENAQTVTPASTTAVTDGPLVPGETYAYRIQAFYEQWTSPVVDSFLSAACTNTPAASAVALVSRSGETDPVEITWDVGGFFDQGVTAPVGHWRTMAAAAAPTRDEVIALGAADNLLGLTAGRITGQIRSAGTWSAMPWVPLSSPGSATDRGFDVAYESVSGDAVVVWNNATSGTQGITYSVWDGSTWSAPDTIDTPLAGAPGHVRLAADPSSDEMILVASNSTGQDYSLVWDGDEWVAGAAQVLDPTGGDEPTTVTVAYEQQTGDAMVLFGRAAGSLSYRVWNGGWTGETAVAAPTGVTGVPRWTTVATHAGSDRLMIGTITTSGSVWLAHWTGTSWQGDLHAGTAWTSDALVLGLGFEDLSGRALAVYGRSGTNAPSYRGWSPGTGWSAETIGPNLGTRASSTIVRPRPGSNEIMVVVQDASRDLVVMRWDGSTFVTSQGIAKSNDSLNQPFELVWE